MEIDTGFWYFVSFAIFVGAAAGPVKKLIMEALQNKSAEISKDLSEAEILKEEAAFLLSEAKQRQAEAHSEASQIIAFAQKEAARALEQSKIDIEHYVKSQEEHLKGRIKQLENTAVKEVHDQMIEIAIETAHDVVKQTLTPQKDQEYSLHELKKLKYLT